MATNAVNGEHPEHRVLFGENPDVTFVFPDNGGATVLAEKLKLQQISDVFCKQFSAEFDMSEKISIKDISFEIFESLMKFIYEDQVEICAENYQEMLYAASKYFIYGVILKVIEFTLSFITAENLTDHYEVLEKYNIRRINDHVLKICIHNPLKLIEKLDTTVAHMNFLKMILESPVLAAKEYDLYVAVAKMMERASNDVPDVAAQMRKKLGNLIHLIRFPVMTIRELILCGKSPSLLTKEQLVDLLLFVQTKDYGEVVQFFSSELRVNPNPCPNPYEHCPLCKVKLYCNSCKRSCT